MTKKHFIDLADTIRLHNSQAQLANQVVTAFTQDQIDLLAFFCQQQSPKFKRERWLGYVKGANGPNGGKV